MKTFVICTVPTAYQSTSIHRLCGGYQKLLSGELQFKKEFPSEIEAKSFLRGRVKYLEGCGYITPDQLSEMWKDIRMYGQVSFDAATATIEIEY